jgi:hypothetical protein
MLWSNECTVLHHDNACKWYRCEFELVYANLLIVNQFNWVISSNRSNHADQTRSFQRYKSLLKMIKFTQNCLILPTKKVVDESFKQNMKGCSTLKFHMIRAIRNWIWTSIEISSKVIDYLEDFFLMFLCSLKMTEVDQQTKKISSAHRLERIRTDVEL